MKDETEGFSFPLCPPRVSIWSCFSFLFLPLFSSLTPYSWSLPPPLSRWFVLSLSQCSCPLLIFTSMFSLPHHIPLSPPPPFHPHSVSSPLFPSVTSPLFLLYYFRPLSLSLSHPRTLLRHSLTLFPSVMWKLSPLWGYHAEDLSPSAPAVPPKVT